MMNEADNQIGAMAQTSKSVIGHVPDFFPIHRHSIFHSCLDVAVTKLFWIDVRRTRCQPFNMNRWVFSQVRHRLFAPMNRGSVPYHSSEPGVCEHADDSAGLAEPEWQDHLTAV